MVANRNLGHEGPEQEKRVQKGGLHEHLEDSISVQLKCPWPFSSLSKPTSGTWWDFTIKSGVGENSALGRPVVIHLLGQAIHLTDGETEAWGGTSQTKQLIRGILLEQWFLSGDGGGWILLPGDIWQCLETFLVVMTGDS